MTARPNTALDPAGNPPLPAACERLLHLPLAQPARAEQEFIELLDATLQAPPDRAVMFKTLEQVRDFLCFFRESLVRQYLEDAPHLDDDRERLFQQGIEATRRMISGYASCANLEKGGDAATLSSNPGRARLVATVLHRRLYYNSMIILEYYRAKRELPAGTWARHHSLFATASRLGVATLQINDEMFDEPKATHCQAAFVTPLLAEQAGPYGRSPRDLCFIWRWAEKVAPDAKVLPASESPSTAFGVDLGQDTPLRAIPPAERSPASRLLETGACTGRLRRILDQLERGIPPENLGVCEEGLDQTKELLQQLIFLWSLGNAQRRQHPRFPRQGRLQLCAGFQAMHHFLLSADPNPACVAQLKRLEKAADNYHEEMWEILDGGPAGFRLACQNSTYKLKPSQLVALCPTDGTPPTLGQVAWLRREQQGRLVVGIALLPGTPLAVSVRFLSQLNGEKNSTYRAILLRQEVGNGQGTSLFLTLSLQGRAGRIEVAYDQTQHMLLGQEIQRGADFVQVGVGKG